MVARFEEDMAVTKAKLWGPQIAVDAILIFEECASPLCLDEGAPPNDLPHRHRSVEADVVDKSGFFSLHVSPMTAGFAKV